MMDRVEISSDEIGWNFLQQSKFISIILLESYCFILKFKLAVILYNMII